MVSWRWKKLNDEKICRRINSLVIKATRIVHPSIMHDLLSFTGRLGDWSLIMGEWKGTPWDEHPFMLTFTLKGNLKLPVNSDCQRHRGEDRKGAWQACRLSITILYYLPRIHRNAQRNLFSALGRKQISQQWAAILWCPVSRLRSSSWDWLRTSTA